MEAAELIEVSVVTVVETLWPLPMLLSVLVLADGRSCVTETLQAAELIEVSVMTVVQTLWPMPLLLSVSVAADGRS